MADNPYNSSVVIALSENRGRNVTVPDVRMRRILSAAEKWLAQQAADENNPNRVYDGHVLKTAQLIRETIR